MPINPCRLGVVVAVLSLMTLKAKRQDPHIIPRHVIASDVVRGDGRWMAATDARQAFNPIHMRQAVNAGV